MLGGASTSWCTEVIGHAPILAVHAHLGHVEMVGLLLEMGAPVEGITDSGMAPLSLAAAAGHADIVSLLCKKGAKVSFVCEKKREVGKRDDCFSSVILKNPSFTLNAVLESIHGEG